MNKHKLKKNQVLNRRAAVAQSMSLAGPVTYLSTYLPLGHQGPRGSAEGVPDDDSWETSLDQSQRSSLDIKSGLQNKHKTSRFTSKT